MRVVEESWERRNRLRTPGPDECVALLALVQAVQLPHARESEEAHNCQYDDVKDHPAWTRRERVHLSG
jgi:hypothetical protein